MNSRLKGILGAAMLGLVSSYAAADDAKAPAPKATEPPKAEKHACGGPNGCGGDAPAKDAKGKADAKAKAKAKGDGSVKPAEAPKKD